MLPGAGRSDRLALSYLLLVPPRDRVLEMDPKMGVSQRRSRGKIIGMLVVTIATKVSRTAHEPACCAPVTGFCDAHKSAIETWIYNMKIGVP